MRVTDFLHKINQPSAGRMRVGLIGFGKTNRAVYGRIDRNEYDITVRCNRPCGIPVGTRAIFGDGYLDGIDEDVIFRSPGFRPDLPSLCAAAERGAVLTSEMELFLSLHPCPTYAVTGSDGKTTTSTLTSGPTIYSSIITPPRRPFAAL